MGRHLRINAQVVMLVSPIAEKHAVLIVDLLGRADVKTGLIQLKLRAPWLAFLRHFLQCLQVLLVLPQRIQLLRLDLTRQLQLTYDAFVYLVKRLVVIISQLITKILSLHSHM